MPQFFSFLHNCPNTAICRPVDAVISQRRILPTVSLLQEYNIIDALKFFQTVVSTSLSVQPPAAAVLRLQYAGVLHRWRLPELRGREVVDHDAEALDEAEQDAA